MPEAAVDIETLEKTELKKEKFSFLKWLSLLIVLLMTVILTWIWNLEEDQKKIYLRYLGFEQQAQVMEPVREYNQDQSEQHEKRMVPSVIAIDTAELPQQDTQAVKVQSTEKKQPTLTTLSDVEFVEEKQQQIEPLQGTSIFPLDETKLHVSEVTPKQVVAPPLIKGQQADVLSHLQHLISEIHELRQDLKQNQQDQVMLHQANIARQKLDLHTRLKWVLIPSNHWMHLYLYWQDISALAMLSDTQRAQATEQADIAREHMQKVLEWRQHLRVILYDIQHQEHDGEESLIPKDGDPWLAWLSGHFQLNHMPKKNSDALLRLQKKIQELLLLGDGEWPEEEQWHALHKQILILLSDKDQIETLNFEKAKADRQAMKELAIGWLEK
ncbi:MAG: hypothetical protein Q9M28_00070 [Mariprofundaceae bacterium]|nr:hypothetical protein [Mariprofundaceae bacterium]